MPECHMFVKCLQRAPPGAQCNIVTTIFIAMVFKFVLMLIPHDYGHVCNITNVLGPRSAPRLLSSFMAQQAGWHP